MLNRIVQLLVVLFVAFAAKGETVFLYSDNGEGGIHQSVGRLVVDEGQYYVDLPVATYGGRTKTEHLKVYRVMDSARRLYDQPKWTEKYAYVVERGGGYYGNPCYFNMKSEWRPSLTDDPDNPGRVVPVRKLLVYETDFNGGQTAIKVVLIKTQGKYMLYFGDDFFAALIESNARPLDYAPDWSRKYKYRAQISGFDVYFDL